MDPNTPVLGGLFGYIGSELSSIPTTLGYLVSGVAQSGFNAGYGASKAGLQKVGIQIPDASTAISDVSKALDNTSSVDLANLGAGLPPSLSSGPPFSLNLGGSDLLIIGGLIAVVLLVKGK